MDEQNWVKTPKLPLHVSGQKFFSPYQLTLERQERVPVDP